MDVDSFSVSSTKLIIYLNTKVLAGNSVFLTLDSAIYGEDYVGTNPVSNYEITNNSLYNWISTSQLNECIIYPNPVFNNIINYSIPGNYTGQIAIKLFKIDGTLIDTRYLFNSTGSVDYNYKSIKQGAYILKITSPYDEYSKLIMF